MSYPANFTMLKRGYGISDPAHTVQKYPIGATFTDEAGNVYEYVKTASAVSIAQYGAVLLLAAGAQALTSTLAAAKVRIGIAQVAVTAITSTYQYLWVLTKTGAGKTTSLKVAALCAAYAGLFSTATAGVVDDAFVDGCQIDGLCIGTAATDAATATTAYVSFPFIRPTFAAS
jgi:hypothetical protein